MRFVIVSVVAVLFSVSASAAEPLKWVKQPELTFTEVTKKWYVTFELETLSDVEVAIVDPKKSTVIRH